MTEMTGLGRLHTPDPRDQGYLLGTRPEAKAVTAKYWQSPGPVLDQGSTSECVIHAGDKYLTARPICNESFGSAASRTRVYKLVQQMDVWPGEDYDGTSVRALMKYLKSMDTVREYRWAFEVGPVIDHLLTQGPVVLGTNWYMGMFATDRHGYITPEGENVGGHAYLALGANRKRRNPDKSLGAVRILNSWGPRWGDEGKAWISFNDLDRLIKEDGEACCATEIKPA